MINSSLGTLANPIKYNPEECIVDGLHGIECLYATICPQMNQHIITLGLWILGIGIIFSWLSWWFFNHGYKKVNWLKLMNRSEYYKIFGEYGNLMYYENRIFWMLWLKDRFFKFMLLYIAMVVWMSININI